MRLRAAVERIRTRGRLRQRIGANRLAAGQSGQIFLLLLLAAKVDDRQRSDAGMRTPGRAEAAVTREPKRASRSAIRAEVTLSSSMPPYCSGTSAPLNPSSPALRTNSRKRT